MNSKPEAIRVNIKLKNLQCLRHRESWLGDRPYMWNIFVCIDGDTLTIEDHFRFSGGGKYHFSEGSHGNIGEGKFPKGEKREIPKEVGEWELEFVPLMLPHFESPVTGVIGCLSVVMEENNLSWKGAEAGHQFLNEFVRNSVDKALNQFDPREIEVMDLQNSLNEYFKQELESLTEGIESKLGKAVVGAQNILENLWSLVRKDTLIGYEFWTFTYDSIMESDGVQPFFARLKASKGEEWELAGEVRVVK